MTCSHCSKEFGSEVQVCPECGRTLAYGAAPEAVPAALFDPTTAPAFDMVTTMSVSGSSSIRSRLRPRTALEIIGEAFELYKNHWKLFTLVVLSLYAPLALIQFGWEASHLEPMDGGVGATFLFLLVAYAAIFLTIFVLTRAVSDIYLGKIVTLKSALTFNSRFWGFLGAALLTALSMFVLYLMLCIVAGVLAAGIAAAGSHGSAGVNPVTLLAVMLPLILVVVLALLGYSVWFIAAGPAAVVEGRGSWGSITRSFSLVKGFYWKAVGIALITCVVYTAIQIVIVMPFWGPMFASGFATAFQHPGAQPMNPMAGMSTPLLLVGTVLGLLANSITLPLVMLPCVLFYYDLRIRKEAFDLQMLAEQLGYGVRAA